MNLTEIENLPLDELLARKDELIESIKDALGANDGLEDELAERYVQARTDARTFDANQAKQATTLAALTTGLSAAEENAAAAKDAVADAERNAVTADQRLALALETGQKIQANLQSERQRSGRLKTQADRFVTVVTSVEKLARDAINLQVNDDANEGE